MPKPTRPDILDRMFDDCLRLAVVLNGLAEQAISAPFAERALTGGTTPHHVHDPDGLLGLDPVSAVPVRQALARLEHLPADRARPVWALLLPRPGRMAGLRGPVEVNREALEAGAVVMTHDGSLAWLGRQVGAGVQWVLARAERPLPPLDPRESARVFPRTVAHAVQALDGLDVTGGDRPEAGPAPVLGRHYPTASQALLDRAWTVLAAAEAGLAQQHEVLHSHAVLMRERHLRELADAALDAVSASVSWPTRSMEV